MVECSSMAWEIGVQSQIESYQRLKYLIPPCLTLSIIRYVSRVKWSNPGKGVAPSPTPRCSSYWKGSLPVALDYDRQLYFYSKRLFVQINMSPGWKINSPFSNTVYLLGELKQTCPLPSQKWPKVWKSYQNIYYFLEWTYCNLVKIRIIFHSWLFGFYGISTFVGYLTPNPFLYK